MHAQQRDRVAAGRDETAQDRDEAAAAREREAAEFLIAAYDRYDVGDYADAEAMAKVEGLYQDEETVQLDVIAAHPELAAALRRMQNQIDDVYAALLAAGVQRTQARADLRVIAQHLAAAAGDRQASEQDRQHAHTHRAQGRADRDNAATSRQQSAINRAPRSQDL